MMISSSFLFAQIPQFIDVQGSVPPSLLDAAALQKHQKIINRPFFIDGNFVEVIDFASLQEGGEIEFDLPNLGCSVKTRSYRVKYLDENNYSWSARVINDDSDNCHCADGSVTLIRKNGKYIGQFAVDEYFYELNHIKEGKHYLSRYEFDESLSYGCGNMDDTLQEYSEEDQPTEEVYMQERDGENCPIRILVMYTPAAIAAVPDINATVELAMTQLNSTLQNSEVDFEIILADTTTLDFIETPSMAIDVIDYPDSMVQSMRDAVDADLTVLLTNGSYNLYGRVREVSPTMVSNAFAIVQAKFATSALVFVHEVGHLLGGRHNNDPNAEFERSKKFTTFHCLKRKRTVMWSKAHAGQVIPNFSNPDIYYLGTSTGKENKRDNARIIRERNCEVALFDNDDAEGTSDISAYIDSPQKICLQEDIFAYAIVAGGAIGTYTFAWEYSYDGVNYTNTGETNICVSIPGLDIPSSTSGQFPIYIKLIVSDMLGITKTVFKSVNATNEQWNGDFNPCAPHFPFISNDDSNLQTRNIQIAPSPAGNQISILISGEVIPSNVKVIDTHGKVRQILSEGELFNVDISNLEKGIYFIHAKINGENIVSRFLKI